jgi:hypothetical protein
MSDDPDAGRTAAIRKKIRTTVERSLSLRATIAFAAFVLGIPIALYLRRGLQMPKYLVIHGVAACVTFVVFFGSSWVAELYRRAHRKVIYRALEPLSPEARGDILHSLENDESAAMRRMVAALISHFGGDEPRSTEARRG